MPKKKDEPGRYRFSSLSSDRSRSDHERSPQEASGSRRVEPPGDDPEAASEDQSRLASTCRRRSTRSRRRGPRCTTSCSGVRRSLKITASALSASGAKLTSAPAPTCCLELLPVLDNFERALVEPGNERRRRGSLRHGVELIHKQFKDALTKFGLQPVESVGQLSTLTCTKR